MVDGDGHERSALGKGLARPGPEGVGEPRLHRAEGGTAGQGDGRVARQLLLAFCRYRRVPCRDPARWHEVAAEQIIANVEAASKDENPLALLLRRVFGERLTLERAVRTWASVDPAARAAVQAIDRRRLSYVESLLTQSGLSADAARARAQILYWAFLGFALSDQPLPKARQQAVLDELVRIATS